MGPQPRQPPSGRIPRVHVNHGCAPCSPSTSRWRAEAPSGVPTSLWARGRFVCGQCCTATNEWPWRGPYRHDDQPIIEAPMLPNHDVFRADRVRGSSARAVRRHERMRGFRYRGVRLSDQDAGRGCGGLVLTAGCLANPSCCRPLAGSARGCRHPVRNRPGRLGACGGPERRGPSGAGRGCGDRCGRAQENPHPRGARRQRPKLAEKTSRPPTPGTPSRRCTGRWSSSATTTWRGALKTAVMCRRVWSAV